MIFDIHSHLLPGVDDGSPSMEDSLQLVREQIEDGVTEMILTPHYRLDWYCEPKEHILEVYEEFCRALDREGLSIITHLGEEAHDDPEMLQHVVDGRCLTLAGTKYFLLELSWGSHNEAIVDVVKEYVNAGFVPIIVHYERFPYKTTEEIKALRKEGALFQVNAYSLLAAESEENRDFALKMLDEDLVDFIATDYHKGKPRKTVEAYDLIGKLYGEEKRNRLFYENAKSLIPSQTH